MKLSFRGVMLALALVSQVTLPVAATAQLADEPASPQASPEEDGQSYSQAITRPGQDPFYCGERKLGTWFYCDRPKDKAPTPGQASPSASATDRLAMITKQLDEMRAKAILEPSTQNVAAYIRYQREQLDRASTFADVWQRALWQDPSLDYTLQRPVNTIGKSAWQDQRNFDVQKTMSALAHRYGVFFFYSSSCGACEAFSPILKSISDRYNFSVLPVSMDGGPNPYFQNYVVNQGQYEKMSGPLPVQSVHVD